MVVTNSNRVDFRFFLPQAQQVYLVGDFNGWREDATPMMRTADGHWRVSLCLPAGIFRFRYRAEERWFTDPTASEQEPGPFGPNSVVRIRLRDSDLVH